ncbi:MAG: hypothetical protein AAGA20_16835 [Planctomycetota bacterium]
MFRSTTLLSCATGALIAATLSFGLAPQDPDPEVAALKAKVEDLESKVDAMDAYMAAQSKAGASLMDSLAKSEAEGFTAGINPRSREILLAGLRASAEAMQSGGGDEDEVEEPRSQRGRRRGR